MASPSQSHKEGNERSKLLMLSGPCSTRFACGAVGSGRNAHHVRRRQRHRHALPQHSHPHRNALPAINIRPTTLRKERPIHNLDTIAPLPREGRRCSALHPLLECSTEPDSNGPCGSRRPHAVSVASAVAHIVHAAVATGPSFSRLHECASGVPPKRVLLRAHAREVEGTADMASPSQSHTAGNERSKLLMLSGAKQHPYRPQCDRLRPICARRPSPTKSPTPPAPTSSSPPTPADARPCA